MTRVVWAAISVAVMILILPTTVRAQTPFFGGGAAIFDPEISVVNTGQVMDATATVSADRRYVTLTSRFQQANLTALQTFSFQSGSVNNQNNGNDGFVGGVSAGPAAPNNGNNLATAAQHAGSATADTKRAPGNPIAAASLAKNVDSEPRVLTILTRAGMTRLDAPRGVATTVPSGAAPKAEKN